MAQPMTVTVGPLATASATTVSLSQKSAAAGNLVINGASAAGTFSANSACLSQTPAGAGALVLNGALATTNSVAGAGGTADVGAAVVRFAAPTRVYITGGSDESGKTFAVVGTVQSSTSFGPGVVITETITGPNASVVASANLYSTIISITASAGTTGAITVGNSGTATLDLARHIIITSGGNDTGVTFSLYGTDWNGDPQSESITGASGAAASSVLDYLTVTRIQTSAAVATTVTVGTNGVAASQWVRFDSLAAMSPTAIQCTVSGTVNATVQQTLEDPNIITNQLPTPTYRWSKSGITWLSHADAGLVGLTANVQGGWAYVPTFARVLLNSGSGAVTMTVVQSYMR